MNDEKEYRAVLLLGVVTDTQDVSGKIIEKTEIVENDFSVEKIQSTFEKYLGEQTQIPPMYSAIKVNGKKLYEIARQGKEVERKPRKII
jgi:tRNA pseudouridine55 synthase